MLISILTRLDENCVLLSTTDKENEINWSVCIRISYTETFPAMKGSLIQTQRYVKHNIICRRHHDTAAVITVKFIHVSLTVSYTKTQISIHAQTGKLCMNLPFMRTFRIIKCDVSYMDNFKCNDQSKCKITLL